MKKILLFLFAIFISVNVWAEDVPAGEQAQEQAVVQKQDDDPKVCEPDDDKNYERCDCEKNGVQYARTCKWYQNMKTCEYYCAASKCLSGSPDNDLKCEKPKDEASTGSGSGANSAVESGNNQNANAAIKQMEDNIKALTDAFNKRIADITKK